VTVTWHAPGRVNVIGEHTDYNDGYVLPIALPHGVRAAVSVRTDDVVRISSAQKPGVVSEATLGSLRDIDGFAAYAAGVVWVLREDGHPVPGLDIGLDGNVPQGAGLSSSAALESAVAAALNDVLDLGLDSRRLAAVAQRAENDFVGMPCGILDQSASLMTEAGHAMFLDCRTMAVRQVPFDLAAHGLELLVIDTKAPHRLVDSEYAERRASCAEAAALLGVRALRDVVPEELERAEQYLEYRQFCHVRHVVTENERVLHAVSLLDEGADLRLLGPVLTASHASLRDDYEVTVPELDAAAGAALAAGAHGARMTGGGFGGSVIALIDAGDREAVSAAVKRTALEKALAEPAFFPVVAGPGARAC
jgi:galactokinase